MAERIMEDYNLCNADESDVAEILAGYVNETGNWIIKKITDSSITYATVENNNTIKNYEEAWTKRAELTFGSYDQAI